MRYNEIKDTVTSLKNKKALDKPAIRKAIKVLRNPKKSTNEKYEVLDLAIPNEVTNTVWSYFMDMKQTSRKPWTYVAQRMEDTLLSKVARAA